jgi:pimeloyl-ACP methyl ester carboxylesterase
LCLQHFTGTLNNWAPAVIDPLALGREIILFESAGMAAHALAFVDALGLKRLDILGYSLGGMVAQQVALERPSLVHKMLLVSTAPEGGEDIMHMDKPELRKITEDPNMPGLEKLVKLFFAPSESSQAAGEAFAARLAERASGRPKCRNRSDHGLSSLGTIQRRAFRQARQDHAVVPGLQRRLRQYDSSPQFLHAERASPKCHAVDLPRRWAWIVVPVSQVIRSASFAVSRFRGHQLRDSAAS